MLSSGKQPVCGRRAGLRSSGDPANLTAKNAVLMANNNDSSGDKNDAGDLDARGILLALKRA